jgi:hypothetical protein
MAGGVAVVRRGVAIDHHEYAHDSGPRVAFDDRDGRSLFEASAMNPAVVPADRQTEARRSPRLVGAESVAPDEAEREWMEHAVCRGVGAAEFFDASGRGRRRCRVCPVAEVCFWWAIVAESDLGYRFGVWGGASPAVRAQVARVTGIDYARARFAAAAGEWAQGLSGRPAERALVG